MAEFSFSNTIKKSRTQFSSLFCFLFSSIVSHPLYFSYFIFFLPYILKLISFLSPFFTTISLLLVLLTLSNGIFESSEFQQFEELEVYKIVFDVSAFETKENVVMGSEEMEKLEENCVDKHCLSSEESNQVEEQKEMTVLPDPVMSFDNGEITKHSEKFVSTLGSFSSKDKEKDWKKTLEFKLFEERQNKEEDEECMDSLWETYENDSSNVKGKKNGVLDFSEYEDEEEDDDDDAMDAPSCCLQALKFSSGKMNLGMKKSNFVKISKAFKGFGWLHRKSKIAQRNFI